MMAGLLAVPVGVVVFVSVLALMGRRWTAPVALADAEAEAYEEPPVPYADPWGYYEPPRAPIALPPAQDSRPVREWPALPPAPEPRHALPAVQDRYALPAARPPDRPYGNSPALPPARPAEPEHPPAPPAYLSYPPESYVLPEGRDPYGRPADPEPYERDRYRRPEEPPPEDRRGFPYGPYRHQ